MSSDPSTAASEFTGRRRAWWPFGAGQPSTIRRRIAALVFGLALPMNVLVVAVIWQLAQHGQAIIERDLMQTTRAMAAFIEMKLSSDAAVVKALATSPALIADDLGRFRDEAQRTLASDASSWVEVSDIDGMIRMQTGQRIVPPGARHEQATVDVFRRASLTTKPVVAGVHRDPVSNSWVTSTSLPVARDGRPFRIVSVVSPSAAFDDLVRRQRLPEGWLAGVIDADGRFVARTPDHMVNVGKLASAGWRTVRQTEGIARFPSLEGEPVINANALVTNGSWSVGIGVPERVLAAPIRSTVFWATGAGLALSLVSLLVALNLARRITLPMRQLQESASGLLAGESPTLRDAPPEIERVWTALSSAVDARRKLEVELDTSARQLRAAADGAQFGTHDYEPRTGEVELSPELRRLLGRPDLATRIPVAEALSFVHPDDRSATVENLRRRIAEGAQTYELEFRITRGDGEVRWAMDRGRILRDQAGAVTRISGMQIDITERKHAELNVAAQLAELQSLYNNAPIGLAVLDRDARFVRVNNSLAEMNGLPLEAHLSRSAWEVTPGLRAQIEPVLGRVLAEGEPVAIDVHGETALRPGIERHWSQKWYPVRDIHGRICAAGVTVEEISERIAAEERQRTLVDELSHRVKNTLAIVQSIASQTARTTPDPHAFRDTFSSRLNSLAGAHSLLTKSAWRGASLAAIADDVMAPFRSRTHDAAVSIGGPEVSVPANATITLTLMLHELATNAVKYGGLSSPNGKVELAWDLDADGDAKVVVLNWVESGGPSVSPPASKGFGTRLLDLSAAQLKGKINVGYRPEGLNCQLRFPVEL